MGNPPIREYTRNIISSNNKRVYSVRFPQWEKLKRTAPPKKVILKYEPSAP